MVDLLIYPDRRERRVEVRTEIRRECVKIRETLFSCVLWIPVNTTTIPSCSLKHVWQLLTCLFYKDFMLNNETFMATTIIHSLQEFHIHYQMYVMARKL